MSSPTPAPAPSLGVAEPTSEPTGDEMPMGEPTGDEMPIDEPTADEMPMGDDDMGEPEDDDIVSFKTIQKLTGKLGQKLRKINQSEEPITADDTKYVINSILSALDLSVLSDEDMEEIIGRLEDSEIESSDSYDEPGKDSDDAESSDEIEEPMPEIPEGEMSEYVMVS